MSEIRERLERRIAELRKHENNCGWSPDQMIIREKLCFAGMELGAILASLPSVAQQPQPREISCECCHDSYEPSLVAEHFDSPDPKRFCCRRCADKVLAASAPVQEEKCPKCGSADPKANGDPYVWCTDLWHFTGIAEITNNNHGLPIRVNSELTAVENSREKAIDHERTPRAEGQITGRGISGISDMSRRDQTDKWDEKRSEVSQPAQQSPKCDCSQTGHWNNTILHDRRCTFRIFHRGNLDAIECQIPCASLRSQLYTRDTQLAACTVVAKGMDRLGGEDSYKPGDVAYSDTLKDVIELRSQKEAAESALRQAKLERDKWKNRAKLFRDAYEEKSHEALALMIQNSALRSRESVAIDQPMNRESLLKWVYDYFGIEGHCEYAKFGPYATSLRGFDLAQMLEEFQKLPATAAGNS